MNRLELYGIGALVLLLICAGAYAKGHHVGYLAAESKAEVALAKANEKIDRLQEDKAAAARESSQKYEDERTRHENELLAARATVSDRLCRSASTPVKVPEGGKPEPGAATAAASNPLPQPAQGTDDWRYAFVSACQHDSDALAGWQDWWAKQQ